MDPGLDVQSEHRHKYFRQLASLIPSANPLVLEVGTWTGGSLVAWDEAFGGRAAFFAVDTWAPYWPEGVSVMGDMMSQAAESGEAFMLFESTIAHRRMTVNICRGDSRGILPALQWDGHSFDLVYLDGDHRFDCASSDIAWGLRLTREGGVLCGDDLEVQLSELDDVAAHQSALAEGLDFLPHHNHRARMLDGTQYSGHHPGITQAVADAFGRDVSNFDGLWAMQRTAEGWKRV
jgi:hypothetical protein